MAEAPTALRPGLDLVDDEVFTPGSPGTPWTPNHKTFARGISEWSAISTNADALGNTWSRQTSKTGVSDVWTRQMSKDSVDAHDVARHDAAEDAAGCDAALERSAILAAVRESVFESPFAVSLMDPCDLDQRLLEVSDAFEELTGYGRGELRGRSARLLNESCKHETASEVWCALRHAHETGMPLMASAVNCHKEGWFFWNTMYVRGLIVAKDLVTADPIWFLVAFHCGADEPLDESQTGETFANLRRAGEELRSQICSRLAARSAGGGGTTRARKEDEEEEEEEDVEEEGCPDYAQKKSCTTNESVGTLLQVPQWC